MPVTIAAECLDTPDALLLINALQAHLESFYPPECRHGFSAGRLIRENVPFFVLGADGQPVLLRLTPRTIRALRSSARKEGLTVSDFAEQRLSSV